MTRASRRKDRETERKERARRLLQHPDFLQWVIDLVDDIQPGGILANNAMLLASRATRADVVTGLLRQLSAADPNAVWQLERLRMQRRREDPDGRSSRNDARGGFPGEPLDDIDGGDRDDEPGDA